MGEHSLDKLKLYSTNYNFTLHSHYKMKPTLLTLSTILFTSTLAQHSYQFKNLSDDTFCQYFSSWKERAEKLTPGFSWNIEKLCKNGKYNHYEPGLFCNSLTTFYGNGESWCSAYASCEVGSLPDTCESKRGADLIDYVDCGKFGMEEDADLGFCVDPVYI